MVRKLHETPDARRLAVVPVKAVVVDVGLAAGDSLPVDVSACIPDRDEFTVETCVVLSRDASARSAARPVELVVQPDAHAAFLRLVEERGVHREEVLAEILVLETGGRIDEELPKARFVQLFHDAANFRLVRAPGWHDERDNGRLLGRTAECGGQHEKPKQCDSLHMLGTHLTKMSMPAGRGAERVPESERTCAETFTTSFTASKAPVPELP